MSDAAEAHQAELARERLVEMKELQKFRERLFALVKTPDFQELIIEGFCRKEMAAFAAQAGDVKYSEADRAALTSMSQAGGHFMRYITVAQQQYSTTANDIEGTEQALEAYEAEQE